MSEPGLGAATQSLTVSFHIANSGGSPCKPKGDATVSLFKEGAPDPGVDPNPSAARFRWNGAYYFASWWWTNVCLDGSEQRLVVVHAEGLEAGVIVRPSAACPAPGRSSSLAEIPA
jgi:hypothetical protein